MNGEEYVAVQLPAPIPICLRCGAAVPAEGQAVHTWNHRRLAGERRLGPKPQIG